MLEYINVIVPRDVLEEKYPGGFAAYERNCPNQTFCSDRCITRIGFMGPHGVDWFIGRLHLKGFCYIRDGRCADIAVVDRWFGPCVPCDWLESDNDPDNGPFAAHIEDDNPVVSRPKPLPIDDYPDQANRKNDGGLTLGKLKISITFYVVLPLGWFLFFFWLSI